MYDSNGIIAMQQQEGDGMMTYSKQVNVRVTAEQYAYLASKAEQEKRSVGHIARRIIAGEITREASA